SNRLILVGDVLNMVLPSKMGDIAKAWFLSERGYLPGSLALSLAVFEKAYDILALLFWCVLGLALLPGKGPGLWAAAGTAAALAAGLLLFYSAAFARLVFRLAEKVAPA